MKKFLLIFIFISSSAFSQDNTYSSTTIYGELTAESVSVDNLAIDNSNVGFTSDADLLAVSSGLLTLAGDLSTSSDMRLKTNVLSVSSVLDKILLLTPKKYTFKEDKNNSVKIGFIAQEVDKVVPEVVFTSEEGYLRLEYGKLVAVGIGSIQEQHTRIINMRERINLLKSKVLNG